MPPPARGCPAGAGVTEYNRYNNPETRINNGKDFRQISEICGCGHTVRP